MWKKTGAIYDGDWKEGMRNGFGMYSVKKGDEYVKEYAGGWKNDMRHVCGLHLYPFVLINFAEHTLVPKSLPLHLQYVAVCFWITSARKLDSVKDLAMRLAYCV